MKKIIFYLLLSYAINLNAQWSHVGPIKDNTAGNVFETGRLDCITLDPGFDGVVNQTIYAGSSSGGLWITTDLCNSWNPISIPDYVTFHGVTAIENVATNYKLISTLSCGAAANIAGNIYQYYPTTNVWTASNYNTVAGIGTSHVFHIRVCPSNSQIVLAMSSTGIYRSTDGGLSWALVQTGIFENAYFVPANWNINGYVVYAGGKNNIVYSNDLGLTFSTKTNLTTLLGTNYYADLAITFDSSNPNNQYIYFDALDDVAFNHHLIRLAIDKITATEVISDFGNKTESAPSTDRMCVGAYNQVMYFGSGGLAKYNALTSSAYTVGNGNDSLSGGVPYWSPGHPDSHDMIMLPALNQILYVNDGGCYLNSYTNIANQVYNNSWATKNFHLNISQIFGLSCAEEDENEYMTGEQDTKAFRTNASTTTFYANGTESTLVLIDKFNKNNFFLSSHVTHNYIQGFYNANNFAGDPNGPLAFGGNVCNSQYSNCGGFSCFPGPEFGTNTLFQNPNIKDKIRFTSEQKILD